MARIAQLPGVEQHMSEYQGIGPTVVPGVARADALRVTVPLNYYAPTGVWRPSGPRGLHVCARRACLPRGRGPTLRFPGRR